MVALVLVLLVLKFHLIFLRNVNWDEFLFLAKVHAALRGDPASALQTAYVHAFGWLPRVSAHEVDQIIAARAVMFMLQVATCGLIYLTARELFGSPTAAGVGALVYLTFSYTVDQGTSFRADPIAVFLLTLSLWLIVRDGSRWPGLALAGTVAALAGMVTIKSVFLVPTLVLAVVCLRRERVMRAQAADLLVFGVSALAAFLAFYLLHRHSIALADSYSPGGMVTRSADRLIFANELFPRWDYLESSLRRDFVAWLLLLGGGVMAIGMMTGSRGRARGIGLTGLLLPVLTLVFYRNAFPYFYAFILAAPALLAAGVIAWMEDRFSGRHPKRVRLGLVVLAIALSVSLAERYVRGAVDRTVAQRQLISTVHRMFPQPVAYLDRAPIIASFPKVGPFLSTWGTENYMESGKPIMRELIIGHRPVFLIANIYSIAITRGSDGRQSSVAAEDVAVLRSNFIHHWGAIWVAGKTIALPANGAEQAFEILVPGVYTLESDAAVVIDGVSRPPGKPVALTAGSHRARSDQGPASMVLRWGVGLFRPPYAPVADPLFVPFDAAR